MSGWIGVDLDGTLAHYDGWNNGKIGRPVPAMAARVQEWVANGKKVKVFTARVGTPGEECEHERAKIEAWCLENLGVKLEVTATKDYAMVALWDDRAVQVETNTGISMETKLNHYRTQVENLQLQIANLLVERAQRNVGIQLPHGCEPRNEGSGGPLG